MEEGDDVYPSDHSDHSDEDDDDLNPSGYTSPAQPRTDHDCARHQQEDYQDASDGDDENENSQYGHGHSCLRTCAATRVQKHSFNSSQS